MSNSNNPKLFYNQADYSPVNSGSSSSGPNIIQKPDEISIADLQPPPPYSSDPNQRKSSDSHYGSTSGGGIDEEQEIGLLNQQAPHPFLAKKQQRAPNPPLQQNTSSASNPHQELNTIMPTFIRRQSSGPRRRTNDDPGCCRKWCKYIFVALLIWLMLLKYGDKIGFSPSPSAPISPPPGHSDVCLDKNLVSWESLPRVIKFERNIELVLEGAVSGGRVLVTPLEDRHGGSIVSDIQFTASSLNDDMSYEIIQQEKQTTKLILKMPHSLSRKDCVALNMEIRIPYSADLLRIHVSNVNVEIHDEFKKSVEVVDIKTINGDIKLKKWSGDNIELSTANGNIKVDSLKSDGLVRIASANGDISFTSDLIAKRRIDIVGSNGVLDSVGSIQADDTVDIRSSSSLFQLDTVIADNVFLKNGNGGITVRHLEAKTQVIAKTSNAPITLSVAGEKNNKVVLSTSNGLVNLHLTRDFEGHFEMSTSHGEIKIKDYRDTNIAYQDNTRYLKRGDRLGYGNKGDLTITNSNADILLSFDV